MRVICIVPEYPPDLPPHGLGGVTTYFLNMSSGYVANGAEVVILTSANNSKIGAREAGPQGERVERVFGHRSRYRPNIFGRVIYELQREYRLTLAALKLRRGTVLIELPDWHTPLVAGLLVGTSKTYMKLHGPSDFIRQINGRAPNWTWTLIDFRERFWARRVRLLESGSPVLVEHVRRRWKFNRLIPVTPDPIALAGTSKQPPDSPRKLCPPTAGDSVSIVDIGRLEFRKGQHVVCQSLGALGATRSNWQLRFIGPDTLTAPDGSSYREFCENMIPPDIRDRVRWEPPVPLSDLGQIYDDADIVLISSLDGNYGYTTLQPLAAGACVITTLEPGQHTSQYAKHGESALLYRSDQPSELAALLRGTIDDPDLRARLRRGAAEQAAATLCPTPHARHILCAFGALGLSQSADDPDR